MTPLISIEALAFSRRRGREVIRVLEGVNLNVSRGQVLGIVGRSGVGKSTILNLVAGYLTPDAGIIREDGSPILRPAKSRIVVFQNGGLWPWLTLRQNVALGLGHAEGDPAQCALLGRLGLVGAQDAYPAQLSGGMQKRGELARAILARPRVLMLDEALGSVDPITKQICMEIIREYKTDADASVIAVSHDIDELLQLCDSVVSLVGEPAALEAEFTISRNNASEREEAKKKILASIGYVIS